MGVRISILNPSSNLLHLSDSSSIMPIAYLDNSVYFFSYSATYIGPCTSYRNSFRFSSQNDRGKYFSLKASLKFSQVGSISSSIFPQLPATSPLLLFGVRRWPKRVFYPLATSSLKTFFQLTNPCFCINWIYCVPLNVPAPKDFNLSIPYNLFGPMGKTPKFSAIY